MICLEVKSHLSRHQIQTAIQSYEPTTDAIALVFFAEQPLVVHLKQMHITPAEAFRLMERRRDEFDLS